MPLGFRGALLLLMDGNDLRIMADDIREGKNLSQIADRLTMMGANMANGEARFQVIVYVMGTGQGSWHTANIWQSESKGRALDMADLFLSLLANMRDCGAINAAQVVCQDQEFKDSTDDFKVIFDRTVGKP